MTEPDGSSDLKTLSHASAWVAMLTVVLYIVTGYGMTKRVIDPELAKFLHVKILPIPLFVSLLLHGAICARASLRRWRVFERAATADVYILAIGLGLFGLFLWLYFLR